METIPGDELLILDGVIRRDDNDLVGEWTREAQSFVVDSQQNQANMLLFLSEIEDRVMATLVDLQAFLATARATIVTQLDAAQDRALAVAARLEALLTRTSSAQLTQADLDTLDMTIQETTTATHDVVARLYILTEGAQDG